jgi:sensor histidine kinase YesM
MADSSNFYFRKYAVVKDVVWNAQARARLSADSYEKRIDLMSKEKQLREIQLQKETWIRNILIGSIVFILLLTFLIFRNVTLKKKYEARRRDLAENALRIQILESGKSRAELLQQQSELEMKALRAQMNPHFIFNCLNSINRYIIKNDAAKAADYLTKFARLIRLVLEQSGKPLIPLEEELKGLTLYMDLENIRFENPFQYELHTAGLDISHIMIPTLIMQPFIENAIWHGLHPNEEHQGKISISFSLENEMLHCVISDNGIGISGSMAMKENNSGNRKSFGIELTRQRLQLANNGQNKTHGISFTELKDESGKIAGTSVHIDIPVKSFNLD